MRRHKRSGMLAAESLVDPFRAHTNIRLQSSCNTKGVTTTADFSTLDQLEGLIAHYPGAGDGIVRDSGGRYTVRLQMLPGPLFNGTLPKTPEVDSFIKRHNWRKI